MTAMMLAFHRRLPWWERYALPPEEITTQLAQRAGARQLIRGKPRAAATWVAHFGYGAAAGAVYAPLAWLAPGRPVLKGMLFGLLVWAGSYLGWLPAADILPPATQHPARRNALMIGAHLIWGAVTGLAADRARRLIEEQASA
jgi:putative membrane protein